MLDETGPLNGRPKFHQLSPVSTHDRTNVLERQLKDRLSSLYKEGVLSEQVHERIRPTGSQRSRMYGLPKTHKQDVPWGPILSMIGPAQHELAKWLAEALKPLLEMYSQYCIKDSFSFFGMIRDLLCEFADSYRLTV